MKLFGRIAFSLFIFLFILSTFVVYRSVFPSKVSAFSFFGKVLGDDDDEKDDSKDLEEYKDEDENEDEDKKDEEQKNQSETRTTVVNKDGTRTVTKKKTEDDGKVEIESKTYSVSGKVVEEQKIKSGDDETEVEYKGISEVKFKSKDGEDFKLMIKNDDKTLTKVRYDVEHNYVRVVGKDHGDIESDDNEDDVLIRSEDDGTYEVEQNGRKARVLLPLTVDDSGGSVSVLTGSGEKTINHFPDEILGKAIGLNDSTEVSDVNIREQEGKVVYQLTTDKTEKILGLFKTNITSFMTYNAETGEEISNQKNLWSQIIDILSF